ncbi:hypothetical protein [Maribacter sp.]|uniref:hypothetical protein n=1 Tax=Maribacter sp. TaxID=1897614 RepID=UPI0025C18828|nr:hypothetical protein [Maribacter sp.]
MLELIYRKFFTLLCVIMLFGCAKPNKKINYFTDLGEIPKDETVDDIDFQICHEDFTIPFNYLGVGLVYTGEKPELIKEFESKYNPVNIKGESGFITIRFIINCEGKSGRFRISETDMELSPKKFDKNISSQIIKITKELNGWKPFQRQEKKMDYQQYLVFKISDGVIEKILP